MKEMGIGNVTHVAGGSAAFQEADASIGESR